MMTLTLGIDVPLCLAHSVVLIRAGLDREVRSLSIREQSKRYLFYLHKTFGGSATPRTPIQD